MHKNINNDIYKNIYISNNIKIEIYTNIQSN